MPGIVSSVDPTADKDLREMVEDVVKEMKALESNEEVQKEQKESQLKNLFRKAFPFSQPTPTDASSSSDATKPS
jgi:hypothetical protein